MRVFIDGVPLAEDEATVSVFDRAVERGYGAFEVLRCYDGRVFRLREHLKRLTMSCGIMLLEPPSETDLFDLITEHSVGRGDYLVRVMVTGGSGDLLYESPQRTIVIWEPVPVLSDPFKVLPLAAPWAGGLDHSELTGAKTLSYAPNIRAMLEAQAQGYDDALLISRDGHVLEGPTFSIGWVIDGALETPSLDLGILASITRTAALESAAGLGIPVKEGRFLLDRMLAADEIIGLSTIKEVKPLAYIGEQHFRAGPITAKLAGAFSDLVLEEVGG